ncbi:hypothetical protein TNCV_3027531 [Trichonephila clavipes]|nr:hypothetical protein TNCV_3027531 [Trichonephila clavipes]
MRFTVYSRNAPMQGCKVVVGAGSVGKYGVFSHSSVWCEETYSPLPLYPNYVVQIYRKFAVYELSVCKSSLGFLQLQLEPVYHCLDASEELEPLAMYYQDDAPLWGQNEVIFLQI